MGERLGSGGAGSDRPLRFRGKILGPQAVSQIRRVVRGRRGNTRQAISRHLCELFGWRRPGGDLVTRSGVRLLARLERRGLIRLLPVTGRREAGPRARRNATPAAPQANQAAWFEAPRDGSRGLFLRWIASCERRAFRAAMEEHHSLRADLGRVGGQVLWCVIFS